MATVRYRLDPNEPPEPSKEELERYDALSDEDIDFSDIPELTPEMLAEMRLVAPGGSLPLKKQLTIRLDAEIVDWFKSEGRGYQTRMNDILAAYVRAAKAGSR
ncbi:BrnA antitoxin family protein [Fulvimarina sp. 2208YS6-2-32]|uniref:BrnA antitoxin family protein n=1 Tax=Fulvimarina uroteuthidis TaxID=3098149 RepID=A0ABU5I1D4_9HYPH|nr:BrnA antitoxin family protein [Fulvimarina sp. 2208YS6-2-32]MDY8109031.1 BrnA antitoxin family protein [Fulvimarina sp. 2208YS6-2-32]